MPPLSKELYQEGACIKSFKLVRAGVWQQAGIVEHLNAPGRYPGCAPTRNVQDVLSDLKAQVAANHRGISLVRELITEYGLDVVHAYMGYIQENAEIAVREMLRGVARTHGPVLKAIDYMDDGSPIQLTVTIDAATGSAIFDFDGGCEGSHSTGRPAPGRWGRGPRAEAVLCGLGPHPRCVPRTAVGLIGCPGTGLEVYGNCNAPPAVTYSAIIYCLRCMVAADIPLNQGCLRPIAVRIPEGYGLWGLQASIPGPIQHRRLTALWHVGRPTCAGLGPWRVWVRVSGCAGGGARAVTERC